MKNILLIIALFASLVASATQSPNVVLVITDDQGYGDLSAHGNPILRTPHLDALHGVSVRLKDFHVAPTCAPTRSALQSGHYTNRTGVWHTIMGRSMLREGELTLGQVFKESGYATGMFGKWHLGDNYPFRPEDLGYTEVVRHGAMDGFRALGDPRAVALARPFLDYEYGRGAMSMMRKGALDMILKLAPDEPSTARLVLALLRDPYFRMRSWAVDACETYRFPGALPRYLTRTKGIVLFAAFVIYQLYLYYEVVAGLT